MRRSGAGRTQSPCGRSKPQDLRRFVTERLAAASQEILAAVDRIVAGYEEEASGYRQEIERQRRQLEVLLQPGVRRVDEEEDEDQAPEQLDDVKTRTRCGDAQNHLDLRIRILDDPRTELLSKNVLRTCPVLELKCPRGLQETDFLDLLTSTFPRLAGEDRPFDVFTSDRRRRLRRLDLKTVTAEEILGSVGGAGPGTPALVIRLKAPKEPQTCEDELRPPRTEDGGAEDASSSTAASTQTSRVPEPEVPSGGSAPQTDAAERRRTRPADDDEGEEEEESDSKTTKKQKTRRSGGAAFSCGVCGALHQSEVALVKHAWSHADDPGGVCGVCGERPGPAETTADHLRGRHGAEDRPVCGEENEGEVHTCLTCHRAFELRAQLRAHRRTHLAKKKTHLCGVCGKSLSDYRSLSRHKMTHSGERPHRCQVCGRSFKLAGTLRQHEKIHTQRERSYLCDVCCDMFLTGKQLQIHMRTHTDEKPYRCGECGKGFATKGPLTVHMRVHTGEAPYRCPDCDWRFKRKSNLDNHVTVHTGAKPYVCGVCGKACARKTYLTVHMRTHNGERPYKCTRCDKAFTQSHCLKTHMKSHLG